MSLWPARLAEVRDYYRLRSVHRFFCSAIHLQFVRLISFISLHIFIFIYSRRESDLNQT